MASSVLVGVRSVTLEELKAVPCPGPQGRWHPVPHHVVVEQVQTALQSAGYTLDNLQLGLARSDQRLFGTAVLDAPLGRGVQTAVGFRSSLDKSISLQWLYGSRVFLCGNMCMRSEHVIARKHTTNGPQRYFEAICRAVQNLASFREQEAARIRWMRQKEIDDRFAESFLLRCMIDWRILSPRTLPTALMEWRESSFGDEFGERTAWSLFNAVTFGLKPRFTVNPQAAAAATIRLGALLAPDDAQSPLSLPA